MDDDYGYEYDEGSDLDNWEEHEVFQDHEGEDAEYDEGEDDCDDCRLYPCDACIGCPVYTRLLSRENPTGVYNEAGECIGDLSPLRHPY